MKPPFKKAKTSRYSIVEGWYCVEVIDHCGNCSMISKGLWRAEARFIANAINWYTKKLIAEERKKGK